MRWPLNRARLKGFYQRRAAAWLFRQPFDLPGMVPFVSFTFDDFPRSAWLTGGAILREHGVAGTYYAALGLVGQSTPTGAIFLAQDLEPLLEQGHELGCHSYAHCDSWETKPAVFEQSVVENRNALKALLPQAHFRSLSYPVSPPRPGTKRRMAKYFPCCRCGGQTFNAGTVDRNYLAAFFLERSREQPETVEQIIEQTCEARGWLILGTHDISETPTRFGCTPGFFERIVRFAVASGARVLPVARVWETVSAVNGEAETQPLAEPSRASPGA